MRDIAVLIFLLGCIAVTLRYPWLGVLALAVFTYLSPHRYTWGLMFSAPVYLVLFLVVFAVFVAKGWKTRQAIPQDWRIPMFFLLWFWFLVTTLDAEVPHSAWLRLEEVSKIYLPLILTIWLIDTREKLFYLIAAIAGSIGLVAAKGGIWAIGTGFAHRVYGPPGTQFGGNNEFAIAALMAIPLLVLLLRETEHRWIRYGLMASIPLSFAAAVSSHSRGALVTLGVLVPLMLWHSKRKWLIVPLMFIGIGWLGQNLPEHWFGRMHTIETYEEDASAMSRIETWGHGIRYALSHPITGAGFEGWMVASVRDWHSSYVEMLAEHGFPAFIMWLSLIYGTIWSLTQLPRRMHRIPELKWVSNYSYMIRASLITYAVGTLFLGLSYWTILYHLVFISILVKKFALQELAEYKAEHGVEAGRGRLAGGRFNPSFPR